MNPWGLIYIVIGIIMVMIGFYGSQDKVFAAITGHLPTVQGQGAQLKPLDPTQIGQPIVGAGKSIQDKAREQAAALAAAVAKLGGSQAQPQPNKHGPDHGPLA